MSEMRTIIKRLLCTCNESYNKDYSTSYIFCPKCGEPLKYVYKRLKGSPMEIYVRSARGRLSKETTIP